MSYRYIYEIVNTVNGYTYVGQRTSRCMPVDDEYWGSGLLIRRAIKKYGLSVFHKCILAEDIESKEELDACEKFWIARRKAQGYAQYNIAAGGSGGDTLKSQPGRKREANRKRAATVAAKSPEWRATRAAEASRQSKARWRSLTPEQYAEVCERHRQTTTQSYEDPEFYKRKCAINAKNGPIQSKTQKSAEWIESTGKDSHTRQNIHLASGFFKDRDGKLYTRSAVRFVLKCPAPATWAFTSNWEKRMSKEKYDFWRKRFEWVPNTPENDKLYNFDANVIAGCYTRRKEDVQTDNLL